MAETVSWRVLEAGSWQLPDGRQLEVGAVTTDAAVGQRFNNTWETVSFVTAFPTAPVVLSQVQTENHDRWVKTRQQSVKATGFQVAMEEDQAQTTGHGHTARSFVPRHRLAGDRGGAGDLGRPRLRGWPDARRGDEQLV